MGKPIFSFSLANVGLTEITSTPFFISLAYSSLCSLFSILETSCLLILLSLVISLFVLYASKTNSSPIEGLFISFISIISGRVDFICFSGIFTVLIFFLAGRLFPFFLDVPKLFLSLWAFFYLVFLAQAFLYF